MKARRHRDVAPEEIEVERFERRRGEELVAKAQHHAVVFARVLVRDRRELALRSTCARGVFDQPRVQRALGGARFGDERELGPLEIRAQIVVGDDEPPVVRRARAGDSRSSARNRRSLGGVARPAPRSRSDSRPDRARTPSGSGSARRCVSTGPSSIGTSHAFRCAMTSSSGRSARKHRSSEPGVGTRALMLASNPGGCTLNLCGPNLSAMRPSP